MKKKEELDFILKFVEERKVSEDDKLLMTQLAALWIAYCFHQDVLVDTYEYDTALREVYARMCEVNGTKWSSAAFRNFDKKMTKDLV